MIRIIPAIFVIFILLIASTQAQIKDITWDLGPNLPEFRKGGCFGVVGDKLVSVFGMRFPWGEMETMYIFDPENNLWVQGPDGPMAHGLYRTLR